MTQQEELHRKSSLSSEDRDKLILDYGFLLRSAENQREWENGFKIRAIFISSLRTLDFTFEHLELLEGIAWENGCARKINLAALY